MNRNRSGLFMTAVLAFSSGLARGQGTMQASDAAQDRQEIGAEKPGLARDVQDLEGDNQELKAERAFLRDAREDWAEAADQFGKDSPQAKAAEAGLDKAQAALHRGLADRADDMRDALNDKAQRMKEDEAKGHAVIEADRAALRAAREDYDEAVRKFGKSSPQAKNEEAKLHHLQVVLHKDLGDLRKERHESRDHREHRDVGGKKS